MTGNRAASIRARLKQHADSSQEDFNLVLTRYGLERLLYRLGRSKHADRFLLKGAMLFALWDDRMPRLPGTFSRSTFRRNSRSPPRTWRVMKEIDRRLWID